jgi:hypothetical protein
VLFWFSCLWLVWEQERGPFPMSGIPRYTWPHSISINMSGASNTEHTYNTILVGIWRFPVWQAAGFMARGLGKEVGVSWYGG